MKQAIANSLPKIEINLPVHNSPPALILALDLVVRRWTSCLVAVIGLILFSPIFCMIAIAIRRDSPGPIFYRGRRVGRRGRVFGMLKFRTMHEKPESYQGAPVTAQDDPRISRIGRFLRDTKLNELPQLWNVLVGDMNLVGPRPEDPEIAAGWPPEVRQVILSVRPGVTSPASIIYRDEEGFLSSSSVMEDYMQTILPTKLRLDVQYVRNRNFLTDWDVIFWTAIILLPKVRSSTIPQHLLYYGPLSRVFSRYLSWLVFDFLISNIAVGLAGVIWRLGGVLNIGLGYFLDLALLFSLIFSLFNWLLGMNRVEWSRASSAHTLVLAISCFMATTCMFIANRSLGYLPDLPDGVMVTSAILAYIGFVALRYRERLVTGFASRWMSLRGSAHAIGERVLVVGAGENASLAAWFFDHTRFGKVFNVIGIVDDDPHKQGLRMEGYPVLGTTADMLALVKRLDVGVIVYTIDNITPQGRERILKLCLQTSVHLVMLPDFLTQFKSQFKPAFPCEDPYIQ
jgi:lipopolysaccharide/colanic/teichoic acid biosynthesis glycosyltransferase